MYFPLDAAHTSGGHGWPASTTLLKKNSESQPWTLDGRAPPADITTHRLRIAPSMAFFKRISGGGGGVASPSPEPPLPLGGGYASPGPSPLPLRQDAYSTRRLQEQPLRAPRDVVILACRRLFFWMGPRSGCRWRPPASTRKLRP